MFCEVFNREKHARAESGPFSRGEEGNWGTNLWEGRRRLQRGETGEKSYCLKERGESNVVV